MHRRALLSTLGVAALGGCQALGSDDEPVRLARVEIATTSDEPQAATVRIDADGTTVHESTHEFEGAVNEWQRDVLEVTWPTEAESYEIRVDAESADEVAVERFEEPTEGCLDVIVKLSSADGVGFYVGRHGDCP